MNGQAAESYYQATAQPWERRPPLAGEQTADVCVVGAGYTGLSTALELVDRGFSVAVLEAGQAGWGASGRNGGQVCTGPNGAMEKVERQLGKDDARIVWDVTEAAKDLIRRRVERYGIDCDLKWGYLHAAVKPGHLREIDEMAAEYDAYGYGPVAVLGRDEVRAQVGSERFIGALSDPGAGHFHPLNYCLGLARAAQAAGVTIYEDSPVVAVDTGAAPAARTAAGSLKARFLVLAGNAYLGGLVPALQRRIMPVQSYILATEPLSENRARSLIANDAAISDLNFIVDYFRLSADRRMLFGGRASYTTLEPRDLFGFMRPRLLRVFPQLDDVRLDYCWGGKIGITTDRLPDVGRIGPSTYFAQGYSGHGVALSGMCGKLVAEAIAGQAGRFDVMARFKHPPFPGGKLRTPLLALGMLYYRLKDALP